MAVFASRRDRYLALLGGIALVAVGVGLYVLVRTYAPFLFDARALQAWIDGFGIYAPVAFILLQALQVILAPIPGQALALVAGYLFGSLPGLVYSMIGVVAGSAIAFLIARRFGRPAVERLLDDALIETFDEFVEWVGVPGLFVFVLIPGLPDDAISFLAGLAQFRLRTFLAVIIVGRLPAYVMTVYAGSQLATGQLLQGLVAIAILVTVSVFGYLKQDEIKRRLGGS